MDKGISFPNDFNSALEDLELNSGWNRYRVKMIEHFLNKYGINSVLEIGSGDGNVAIPLSRSRKWVCVEPDMKGAEKTSLAEIETYNCFLSDLQIPSNTIPCVGIFDVIEHIEHDQMYLKEIWHMTKESGHLLLTVPAIPSMYSTFDIIVGHFRRYSKGNLRTLLESEGFKIIECRYIFSFLAVPRYISKLFDSRSDSDFSSQEALSRKKRNYKVLDLVLTRMTINVLHRIERSILVPFGLTLVCIAQRVEN